MHRDTRRDMHRDTHRETGIETEEATGRQAQRQRKKQTYRGRDRQTRTFADIHEVEGAHVAGHAHHVQAEHVSAAERGQEELQALRVAAVDVGEDVTACVPKEEEEEEGGGREGGGYECLPGR
jgi:hypothetical protein